MMSLSAYILLRKSQTGHFNTKIVKFDLQKVPEKKLKVISPIHYFVICSCRLFQFVALLITRTLFSDPLLFVSFLLYTFHFFVLF